MFLCDWATSSPQKIMSKMVQPSYGERIDGVAPYKPVADAMVVLCLLQQSL